MTTTTKNTPDLNETPTAKPPVPITSHPTPLLKAGGPPFSHSFVAPPKAIMGPCPTNPPQHQKPPTCRHGKQYCDGLGCDFGSVTYMPPPSTMFLHAPAPSSIFTPPSIFTLSSTSTHPFTFTPSSTSASPPSHIDGVLLEERPPMPTALPETDPHMPAVSRKSSHMPALSFIIDSRVPKYHRRHKRDPDYPTNERGEQYIGPPAKVRKCGKDPKFAECRITRRAIIGYTEGLSECNANGLSFNSKVCNKPSVKFCATIQASTINQDTLEQAKPLQSRAKVRKPRVRKRVVKESPKITVRLLFRCSSFHLEFRVYEIDIVFICLFFFLVSRL